MFTNQYQKFSTWNKTTWDLTLTFIYLGNIVKSCQRLNPKWFFPPEKFLVLFGKHWSLLILFTLHREFSIKSCNDCRQKRVIWHCPHDQVRCAWRARRKRRDWYESCTRSSTIIVDESCLWASVSRVGMRSTTNAGASRFLVLSLVDGVDLEAEKESM